MCFIKILKSISDYSSISLGPKIYSSSPRSNQQRSEFQQASLNKRQCSNRNWVYRKRKRLIQINFSSSEQQRIGHSKPSEYQLIINQQRHTSIPSWQPCWLPKIMLIKDIFRLCLSSLQNLNNRRRRKYLFKYQSLNYSFFRILVN